MLIFTCTGVSFAHGSNDGQKGMGLIMLILIGVAPLAYSLNKTMDTAQVQSFVVASEKAASVLSPNTPQITDSAARTTLTHYIQEREFAPGDTSVAVLSRHVGQSVAGYDTLDKIPCQGCRYATQ